MDRYSRLLLYFRTVTGSNNYLEPYSNFLRELAVLESPSEELCPIIKDDLHSILPAVLILSTHEDVNIRRGISRTFDTFCKILKTYPSLKAESWWKEMENKIITQHYSSKLIKMVEKNDEPWSDNWVFALKLFAINCDQVHSSAINSLLKVVETAFKMSRKNEVVMEKAYFCWNQLIDVFSVHPRVSVSQKLVELFVRPLSTTHLSLKCPELRMQTWSNLMSKIGFSCGSKCKSIIEPFIDNMFLKGSDSLYVNCTLNCLDALSEIVKQKKLYKYYAMKVLAAFPICCESATTEELEKVLLKIWSGILGNCAEVNKENRDEYILDIFSKLSQVYPSLRPEFNSELIFILVENNIFNVEVLRMCIQAQLCFVPVFTMLVHNEKFRKISLSSTVKQLSDSFSESHNKQQNNIDLQVWDMLCEICVAWIKSSNPEQLDAVSNETLSSLLMIPFISKQWSVVAVQKTWYSVVDAIQLTAAADAFLLLLFGKINTFIKSSEFSISVCIEICTHLTDKDKSAFKIIMPTLNVAAQNISPKEPKPLMDLLVILENSMGHVPKNDLNKFINELMADVNKYEHPWGIRIKTKCSKVLRKLMLTKDSSEEKEEKSQTTPEVDQPSGSRVRSPVMTQSNFLHRLAKAEEKKKKKVPTHASIFGEPSPLAKSTTGEVDLKIDQANKVEASDVMNSPNPFVLPKKEAEISGHLSSPLENGRLSPAIPSAVTIVTHSRVSRSRSRSPEPAVHVKQRQQTLPKAAPPPTYFDEAAQEEYVIVPPKAKSLVLTEHQKEMLSKRRSDIPALYQDLSQDTVSESLKEINLLKYMKHEDKKDENTNVEIKIEKELRVHEGLCDSGKPSSVIQETCSNVISSNNGSSVIGGVKPVSQYDESKCYSVDMFASYSNSDANADSNETVGNDIGIENDSAVIPKPIIQEESVEDTPQSELPITPVKHQSGPPTPRNLVTKLNLIEEMDEEEEREKENKITNAKLSNEKLPAPSTKRRSTRKSVGKYNSKNVEEIKDTSKQRKESVEVPKIVVNSVETVEEMLSAQKYNDSKKNNSKCEESGFAKFMKDFVAVLSPGSIEKNGSDLENLNETYVIQDAGISKDKGDSDINKNNLSEVSSFDTKESEDNLDPSTPILETNGNKTTVNQQPSVEPMESKENLDETVKMSDDIESYVNEPVSTNEEQKKSFIGSILSEENSESPSGDVRNWAMTTSTPGKTRTRKKKSMEDLEQFSPKVLRSKRLSLTKNLEESATKKKMRKSTDVSTPQFKVESSNNDRPSDAVSIPAESAEEDNEGSDKTIEKKKLSLPLSFKVELTPNRKRRMVSVESAEIEDKKKKIDEEINQESILVVKNNTTGKPRKKKVIKSNVKISPNNLEQWLIKSGKNVVKTSLISQETANPESQSPKIIDENPDIQINVSKSNNIVVEKIEAICLPVEITSAPLKITEEDGERVANSPLEESSDTRAVTSMNTRGGDIQNSPSSSESNSSPAETCSSEEKVILDTLQCQETEIPGTPELCDRETYIRSRRRRVVRESTPAREIPSSPEEKRTRPQRTGRSAQMVTMATSDEEHEPFIQTPIRKRSSIQPFIKTENWPEGRMEQWFPCVPTPPHVIPNLGILKRATSAPSPSHSPSSSPQVVKKKRVSFLDPVVYSGLMYVKGMSDIQGQVQYADIPPGEKPLWRAEEDEKNDEKSNPNEETINESPEEALSSDPASSKGESTEELTAIQDFLNSTPDAPWSKTIPPELDLTQVENLDLCKDPLDELLKVIFKDEEEIKSAANDLFKINVHTVADFGSVCLTDLAKFCELHMKAKSLVTTIEDYMKKKKAPDNNAELSVEKVQDMVIDLTGEDEFQPEGNVKSKKDPEVFDATIVIDEYPVPIEILMPISEPVSADEKPAPVVEPVAFFEEPVPVVEEPSSIVQPLSVVEETAPVVQPMSVEAPVPFVEQVPAVNEPICEQVPHVDEPICVGERSGEIVLPKGANPSVIHFNPESGSSYTEPRSCLPETTVCIDEAAFLTRAVSQIPVLLDQPEFCSALTSHLKDLSDRKFDEFIKTFFQGITMKRGLNTISVVANLLQEMQKEHGYNPD